MQETSNSALNISSNGKSVIKGDKLKAKKPADEENSKKPPKKVEEEENEEEENWPAVDVGNLIIGLDADIDQDKDGMSTSGTTATSEEDSSVTNNKASSMTTTVTEAPVSNGANNDNNASNKTFKMKIKRTKNKTNQEGKLEVVNGMDKQNNIVNSKFAKVGKANGKVSNADKANGEKTFNSIGSNAVNSNGQQQQQQPDPYDNNGPPTKKVKVDASVCTEIATMTEPDCMGPMDPGSSVTLEGIVWHETENGVLVINVTWRGKTYVGSLLDSTQHVNQWAPPRYSDSPTSELEGRNSKGRGGKRGRGGTSTPVEVETRKNLRSSKVKGRNQHNQVSNSPLKDKKKKDNNDDKGNGSGSESDKKRTSCRNSPDDDDDSEKEKEKDKENEDNKVKDSEMTPKDKEDEKYVPPPPLPYNLVCPKPGCKKKYRHHNGLKFHVSYAHKELLNNQGEIKDMSEIKKMEAEAKEKIKKKEEGKNTEDNNTEESGQSASSSKTSTPGPAEAQNLTANNTVDPKGASLSSKVLSQSDQSAAKQGGVPLPSALGQLKPNYAKILGPPSDAKPIPVSAIEGVLPGGVRPPALLNGPSVAMNLIGNLSLPTKNSKPVIRPPSNARPIVPATAHQLLPAGSLGPSSSNLKPIQPRPTIMPEPTTNLILDELRRKKEPKKKKFDNSPGTSPPRGSANGASPKINKADPANLSNSNQNSDKPNQPVNSPAYSDISDDNDDADKKLEKKAEKAAIAPSVSGYATPPFSFPFSSPQLPQVPVSSVKTTPELSKATVEKLAAATAALKSPQDYEKMLHAYGFPLPNGLQLPYQFDPMLQMHQLMKAESAQKAKAAADKNDRINAAKKSDSEDRRMKTPPEDLRRRDNNGTGTPNRPDTIKNDIPKPADEGSKPTMETRGPPPSTTAGFGWPALLRHGFPNLSGYEHLLSPGGGMNPLLMNPNAFAGNPFMHLQQRPPFNSSDLMRAPFMNPSTSGAEDLSRSAATKALDMLQQHAQMYQNQQHKMHELQERAAKSPSNLRDKSSPNNVRASPSPSLRKSTPSPRSSLAMSMITTAPSTTTTMAGSDRHSPPMRHLQSPFGLGYPHMIPHSAMAPPGAHSPFSAAGYPNHLLAPKHPHPGFPPPK